MKYLYTIIILICLFFRTYSQVDTGRIITETYNSMRNNPKYSTIFGLEGKQVPDWKFSKLDSINSEIELKMYKGKCALVFFTATYCGYCNLALPFLKELENKYDSSKFVIVGIFDNKSRNIEKHIKDKQIDFSCYKYIGRLKNIFEFGFPTFFIIDQDSKIKRVMMGYDSFGIREKEIKEYIEN